MKRILFLLAFLPLFLTAQYDRPLRVEYEVEDLVRLSGSQLMGNDGVAVYYPAYPGDKDSMQWTLVVHDTNLKVMMERKFKMPEKTFAYHTAYSNDKVYLLYQCFKNKKSEYRFTLVSYNFKTDELTSTPINLPFESVHKIELEGDYLAIESRDEKWNDFAIYNLKTNEMQFLLSENCTADAFWVEFFEFDETKNHLLVGLDLVAKVDNKYYQAMNLLDIYLPTNEYLYSAFPETGEVGFVTARMFEVSDTSRLIVGTCNSNGKRKSSEKQTGLYAIPFSLKDNGAAPYTVSADAAVYKSFEDISLKYRGEKGLKIKTFNAVVGFNMQVGTPFSRNGVYSLPLEIYTLYYTSDAYGRNYFSGYRFGNAYVVSFSAQGELLSTVTFPLSVPLSKTLNTYTSVYTDEQQQQIVYSVDYEQMHSMVVKGNEVIDPLSSNDIAKLHQSDKVARISFGGSPITTMKHWYGDTFLIEGHQKIKNKTFKGKKGKRWVYFISRIDYR